MDIPPLLNPPLGAPAGPPPGKGPKSKGCLSIWVVLLLLYNAMMVLLNLGGEGLKHIAPTSSMAGKLPDEPGWLTMTVMILSAVSFVALIFVFTWRKWAVYGYAVVTVAMSVAYLVGGKTIADSAEILIGPALIFILLMGGGENSGWKRLK